MTLTAFDEDYTAYQLNRGSLRKAVRTLYLAHVEKQCKGPVIDFGCGVGELLERLPEGSVGLEINPASVQHCKKKGLDVQLYDPEEDAYSLKGWSRGKFETLVISHVLEHLSNPDEVLRQLLTTAVRLDLKQLIAIVPGEKGYASDPTHQTFVNLEYLNNKGLLEPSGWNVHKSEHFPFNCSWMGKVFTHNELMVVYRRD